MFDFLSRIFDTEGFPPRWNCGQWSAGHGWLHIGSDLAIFGAYAAIPAVLGYFAIRRSKDFPFGAVLWLGCAFVLSCGVTHLIEASIFWWPWYRLSGVAKLATACVSWAAVVGLAMVLPRALRLPGLRRANQELEAAREELEAAREELEIRVEERTHELEASNRRLSATVDALARANGELENFAYLVSHDLRTPLRGIVSIASWLEEDSGEELSVEVRGRLEQISQRTQRLDRLLRGVLDYSRVGRIDEAIDTVDSKRVAREVADELRETERVTIEVADDLPLVAFNPVRLEQVFRELIANAAQHSGDAPVTIRVTAEERTDEWEFCVADDGPGLEERHFARVFRMFQQLEPSLTSESTGVGLPIVKKVVEHYGGRVGVRSRLGEGCEFWFTVPIEPAGVRGWSRPAQVSKT